MFQWQYLQTSGQPTLDKAFGHFPHQFQKQHQSIKIRCFRLMESISEDSKSIGLEGIKQGLGLKCRRNVGRIKDVIQALVFGSAPMGWSG
jgi:hypothetical protein